MVADCGSYFVTTTLNRTKAERKEKEKIYSSNKIVNLYNTFTKRESIQIIL